MARWILGMRVSEELCAWRQPSLGEDPAQHGIRGIHCTETADNTHTKEHNKNNKAHNALNGLSTEVKNQKVCTTAAKSAKHYNM